MTTTGTPDVGNRTAAVSVARDLVLLLARLGLGVLMVAHAKLEYAIGLLSLVLAVSGAGRLGLDHLLVRRVGRRVRGAVGSSR